MVVDPVDQASDDAVKGDATEDDILTKELASV
jgi:hypothetical protein